MRFQKNIFQVWFQGCDKVDKPIYIQNMQNWKNMNPDWQYRCMSDNDLRKECAKFSKECLATYDSFNIMHLKIDFGRYVTLYNNGGMYADVDTHVIRPLDMSKDIQKILDVCEKQNKHVIGLSEMHAVNVIDIFILKQITMFNNGIIVATPHNPFLKEFIEYIIRISKEKPYYQDQYLKVHHLTGPISLNKYLALYDKFTNTNVMYKFKSTVFDTCISNLCKITEDTICLHIYASSWAPQYMQKVSKFGTYLLDRIVTISLILIILIAIIIYTWIRRNCGCNNNK